MEVPERLLVLPQVGREEGAINAGLVVVFGTPQSIDISQRWNDGVCNNAERHNWWEHRIPRWIRGSGIQPGWITVNMRSEVVVRSQFLVCLRG